RRDGDLPDDPRQQGDTALALDTMDWARTAPFDRERHPDERGQVLTGIVWVITGSPPPGNDYVPAGDISLRERFDGIRSLLREAAAQTRKRKALDLYTRAHQYLSR